MPDPEDWDGPPGPPDDDELAAALEPQQRPGPAPVAPAVVPGRVHDPAPLTMASSPLPDLIPGILPARQVHLLSGASGSGKTALVSALCAAALNQTPFFSFQVRRPAWVGWLCSDRPVDDHRQWFAAAGLPPDLPCYSMVDDVRQSGKGIRGTKDRFALFTQALGRLVDPVPRDSLLIIDPVSLFVGSNFLDYDRVYTHLFDLNQFCVTRGVTILGLAHAGKQKGDRGQRYARPQDRIAGTTAQTGCAGTTLHLSPPNETEEDWYEFAWIPHHAPSSGLRLTRNPYSGLFEPLTGEEPTRRERKRSEQAGRLLDGIPESPEEIGVEALIEWAAVTCGWKRRNTQAHLAQLRADGLVVLGSKRGRWKKLSPA